MKSDDVLGRKLNNNDGDYRGGGELFNSKDRIGSNDSEGVCRSAGGRIRAFFGGELFSSKHLIGNLCLAEALEKVSNGKYKFYLAQNECDQEVTHKAIKDKNSIALSESEVAIFAFEGVEIDSGTVVEFLQAKTLDVPSVVYRTDFRGGSGEAGIDEKRNAWNLMVSFYPRTKIVYMYSILDYRSVYLNAKGELEPAQKVANAYSEYMANIIANAMDEVMASPPLLAPAEKEKLRSQCLMLWGIDVEEAQQLEQKAQRLVVSEPEGLLRRANSTDGGATDVVPPYRSRGGLYVST